MACAHVLLYVILFLSISLAFLVFAVIVYIVSLRGVSGFVKYFHIFFIFCYALYYAICCGLLGIKIPSLRRFYLISRFDEQMPAFSVADMRFLGHIKLNIA